MWKFCLNFFQEHFNPETAYRMENGVPPPTPSRMNAVYLKTMLELLPSLLAILWIVGIKETNSFKEAVTEICSVKSALIAYCQGKHPHILIADSDLICYCNSIVLALKWLLSNGPYQKCNTPREKWPNLSSF